MNSNWTGRFPRTTAEALGCDGHAIYLYKPPLHRRFFYALCRHGWVLFVVALAVLVLSGCSDIDAEIATAASLADAIADAGKTGVTP